MMIDMSTGWHFRQEGLGLLMAWADPDQQPGFRTDFDPAFIEKILTHAAARVPDFANLAVNPRRCWAGLYEMSPDHHAILGPAPELRGFYFANGFSGHGVMHSPGHRPHPRRPDRARRDQHHRRPRSERAALCRRPRDRGNRDPVAPKIFRNKSEFSFVYHPMKLLILGLLVVALLAAGSRRREWRDGSGCYWQWRSEARERAIRGARRGPGAARELREELRAQRGLPARNATGFGKRFGESRLPARLARLPTSAPPAHTSPSRPRSCNPPSPTGSRSPAPSKYLSTTPSHPPASPPSAIPCSPLQTPRTHC